MNSNYVPGMRQGIKVRKEQGSVSPFTNYKSLLWKAKEDYKMLKIAVHVIGEIIIYRPDLKVRFPFHERHNLKLWYSIP